MRSIPICEACVRRTGQKVPTCFFVCQASNTDAGGEEAVVTYRYEINPVESFKTNCFKPNVLNANCDPEGHKSWALGAVLAGNFDRLPRQDKNKTASLVWEADVFKKFVVFK